MLQRRPRPSAGAGPRRWPASCRRLPPPLRPRPRRRRRRSCAARWHPTATPWRPRPPAASRSPRWARLPGRHGLLRASRGLLAAVDCRARPPRARPAPSHSPAAACHVHPQTPQVPAHQRSLASVASGAGGRASRRAREGRTSLETLIDLGTSPQELRKRAGRRTSIVQARWAGAGGGPGGRRSGRAHATAARASPGRLHAGRCRAPASHSARLIYPSPLIAHRAHPLNHHTHPRRCPPRSWRRCSRSSATSARTSSRWRPARGGTGVCRAVGLGARAPQRTVAHHIEILTVRGRPVQARQQRAAGPAALPPNAPRSSPWWSS